MPRLLNQRGVAHIFILLILFIGIAVGLVLLKNPKIFSPKAAPVLPDNPEVSFELELEKDANSPFPDDTTPSSIAPDSQFRVDVYARSDTEESNLFSAKVKYSADTVDFVSIEKREGQSFVKNWVDASVDNGVVNLVGGYPNPGIKTDSKVGALLMGSIIFKSKGSGAIKIEVSDTSAIYSNSTNINILTARKGAIATSIQSSQPTPTPTPASTYSCKSIDVTGGIQGKNSSGETIYIVDSEGTIKLTAQVSPADAKIEWKEASRSNNIPAGHFETPNSLTTMYKVPKNTTGSNLEGVTIRADIPNSDTSKNPLASCLSVTLAIKGVFQGVEQPKLFVNPTVITRNGIMKVEWSGISNPHKDDFITVVGGLGLDHGFFLNSDTEWCRTGSGVGTPKESGSCLIDLSKEREFSGESNYWELYRAAEVGGQKLATSNKFIITQSLPGSAIPTDSSYRRVFATSFEYTGNLGGLSGADAKCQDRANVVNLGGVWKAWASSNNTTAASRLEHPTVPYKLLNGVVVANNWTDLTDPNEPILTNPINITETMMTLPVPTQWNIWTNTSSSGSIYNTQANSTCSGWTSDSSSQTSMGGATSKIDSQWTSSYNVGNQTRKCNDGARLYCFEQLTPAHDIYLLGEFLQTFGLTSSDSKFNSKYDYNSDGRISVVDYSGLLSKFDPKSFQLKTGYSVDELIPTYNKTSTDSGFNAKYDVNSDKTVNKDDYTILNQDTVTGNGDGNNDGKVDFADLSILLTDYNKNQSFRTGIDINGDGKVNSFDFGLMKNLLIQNGLVKST